MFNVYVFMLASLCVFGFTESAVVKRELRKRHIVNDPLITMFTKQETLLRNMQQTMLEKSNKLESEVNTIKANVNRLESEVNTIEANVNSIMKRLHLTCPAGYVGNEWGCYKLNTTNANFDAARRQCQDDGAHLVQLHSSETLSRLIKLMADNGARSGYWWTGGRMIRGKWTWVDGNVPLTFSNWYTNYATRTSGGSYPVRLVNGSTPSEGRVEINVASHGGWGIVCDDYWDINDANVVCRQLGYNGALDAPHGSRYGYGNGQHRMDDVKCTGSETSLDRCTHRGWNTEDCGNTEAAGVICQGLPGWPTGTGDCVMMLYSPTDQHHSDWNNDPCTSTRPFVCEI